MGNARVLVLALLALGCRPAEVDSTPPERAHAIAPVEHEQLPFVGSFVGPTLRLEFGGAWVLVEPAEPAPGQAPIELRVEVVRREGDAFALRTSIAGAMPADFLRPPDWTLLVEDGALALAMGDEPLESYVRDPGRPSALIGPVLVEPLPDALPFEHAIACLELASMRCAALEQDGPRGLGCREALWSACVAHPAEPSATSNAATMLVHVELQALRWAEAVQAAAPLDQRELADALHRRALVDALGLIRGLSERDELDSRDEHVQGLLTRLRWAAEVGLIARDALDDIDDPDATLQVDIDDAGSR